jgi:hypothetical protein
MVIKTLINRRATAELKKTTTFGQDLSRLPVELSGAVVTLNN